MKKGNPAHQPKTLTPKQRRFVDQLIERFGETHTNVKRAELKKAAKELLGTLAAPRWITRNMTVRKSQRGMYDLSVLVKLPIVDESAAPAQTPPQEQPAETPKPKKVPAKKTPKPKRAGTAGPEHGGKWQPTEGEPRIEEQEAAEDEYGPTNDTEDGE